MHINLFTFQSVFNESHDGEMAVIITITLHATHHKSVDIISGTTHGAGGGAVRFRPLFELDADVVHLYDVLDGR